MATGVTFALLTTKSVANRNDFTGALTKVNVSIVEQIDGEKDHEDATSSNITYPKIKKGDTVGKVVKVKNLNAAGVSTTDTYVRVKLIPTMVKDDTTTALGENVDITYTFAENSKWSKTDSASGAVYYYTEAVKPGMTTDALITGVTLNSEIKDGYHLEIQVLADAISANPVTNLETAWGLVNNGSGYFEGMSPLL